MEFRKIGFVASQKPEAIEALKKLKKLYRNVPPNKADIIVFLVAHNEFLDLSFSAKQKIIDFCGIF